MIIEKPIIEGKNITIGYQNSGIKKSVSVLSNLNFEVYRGEMIGLMGQNGCGKTTILKAICRLNDHLAGDIFILNKNIRHYSSEELAKVVSVVLTDRLDLPNTTVEEVIKNGRYPYTNLWHKLDKQNQQIIEEAMRLTGTYELRFKNFNQLSDGQKQKTLIAKAIAQDTPIMLMDEPTSFLDISSKIEILDILKNIVIKKKISILFSTHDWDVVLEVANRVWIVGPEGKLVYGLPEDLILSKRLEKTLDLSNFRFDYEKGKFVLIKPTRQRVKLKGTEQLSLYWTRHALEKEGLAVEDGHEVVSDVPLIEISEDAKSWSLFFKDQTHKCESIDHLIKWLNYLST